MILVVTESQSKEGHRLKQIDNIPITPEQLAALGEIKRRLLEMGEVKTLVLYGSLAQRASG